MPAPNQPAEPSRMTTADLRRRLHAAPSSVPLTFPDDPAPIPQRAGPTRIGEILIDPPSAEEIAEAQLATMADFDPTPVPQSVQSSGYFRRNSLPTRSSLPTPADDPLTAEPTKTSQVNQLLAENGQLQNLLNEMRQLLAEAEEQEQRSSAMILEREQEIETLRQELTTAAHKPKSREELEEWADELERESFKIQQERREFDQEQRQLREDERALEKQMRDMEVQMARERAMLARQETELRRLSAEIQHELEMLQRGDGALRERMQVFVRRHTEVMSGPTAGMGAPTAGASYAGFAPPPAGASYAGFAPPAGASYAGVPMPTSGPASSPGVPLPPVQPPQPKKDTTGLLRKLFRGNSGE